MRFYCQQIDLSNWIKIVAEINGVANKLSHQAVYRKFWGKLSTRTISLYRGTVLWLYTVVQYYGLKLTIRQQF